MIEITRALARRLRAVFRKAIGSGGIRSARPPVIFQAGRDGLHVRVHDPDVAVEYYQTGDRSVERLTVPFDALQDFAGRADTAVALEPAGPENVQARWDDDGVPQVRDYPSADAPNQPSWPELPEPFAPVAPDFIKALDRAAQTAARESIRYALTRLQLRGESGEIVSSDSRQLLIQGGFAFPWKDDLLVPAVGVWGNGELANHPGAIGKTATHVALRLGPWTFLLAIDTEGRFPRVEDILPKRTAKGTTWRLAPEETAFLPQRAGDD